MTYTLDDLRRMRTAITMEIAQEHGIVAEGVNPANVEDRLRTYTANNIRPEEIERGVLARERADARKEARNLNAAMFPGGQYGLTDLLDITSSGRP